MDAARWLRLSPHLDELLELDAPARGARLAEIAGEDADLAAELTRMLALEAEHDDFLAEPIVVPKALLREGSAIQVLGAPPAKAVAKAAPKQGAKQ